MGLKQPSRTQGRRPQAAILDAVQWVEVAIQGATVVKLFDRCNIISVPSQCAAAVAAAVAANLLTGFPIHILTIIFTKSVSTECGPETAATLRL